MQVLAGQLKRWMPKSLFGRALLILVLPIVLLQAVVALVFIQRHYDGVTAQMAGSIAREVNYAIALVDAAPDATAARAELAAMSSPLGLDMTLVTGETINPSATKALTDLTGGVIADTLMTRVAHPLELDLISFAKQVQIRASTEKGVLLALVPRRRMNAANPHLLLVWMVASSILLTGIAIVFLRNQIRPIRDLAKAAVAFGRGRSTVFRPAGAEEVRRAGRAFVDMRTRIERHVEQRTSMLSGVSHDLRTPLTRMKLALAVADDTPEMSELTRDVSEMEHMLAGFLAFARGEGGEISAPVSPIDLAEEVAADARRRGADISLFTQTETPDAPMVDIRRGAMKRALANLVQNAADYGGKVQLSVKLAARLLEFTVEDAGPGIPEDKREDVLRPFTRLDEARNQNAASGTGLGLSIALDIARSHGGALKLSDSARMGGLRAVISVPR